jgi:hypothetical protein
MMQQSRREKCKVGEGAFWRLRRTAKFFKIRKSLRTVDV